jgi:hypothetical protein
MTELKSGNFERSARIVVLTELKESSFEVMDLHGLVEVLNSKLKESGQSIVLLHVRSTVLVKVVVLVVTTVVGNYGYRLS